MPTRRTVLGILSVAGTAAAISRTKYVQVHPEEPSVTVVIPREVMRVVDSTAAAERTRRSPTRQSADPKTDTAESSSDFFDTDWDASTAAKAAHAAVNGERTARGLDNLDWDAELYRIARNYAAKMAKRNFFSHTAPDGSDFTDRYAEAGYTCRVGVSADTYTTGAENIAYTYYEREVREGYEDGYYETPEELGEAVVHQWMRSAGHRKNILLPYWRNEGIGMAMNDQNRVYAVQNFC